MVTFGCGLEMSCLASSFLRIPRKCRFHRQKSNLEADHRPCLETTFAFNGGIQARCQDL
jgi:hypothetical protein